MKRFNRTSRPRVVKGLAHITGGGFIDNIPRILPPRCGALIHKRAWSPPPVFQILRHHTRTDETELYQVFNMGIGMVLIVPPDQAAPILKFIRTRRHKASLIGQVVKGGGRVRLE